MLEQGQQHKIAEASVSHQNVTLGQLAEQWVEHRQFGHAQIAGDQTQNGAAEHGEHHHHPQHGEIRFGALDWRIGFAVFWGVGQGQGGPISQLEPPALEQGQGWSGLVGGLGGGGQGLGKLAQGQAGFGTAVSAVFFGKAGAAVQDEQRLELADDLAAGGLGVKALPEQTPEGAPLGVEAVAAVGFFGRFGEQRLGQPSPETLFELAERAGAHLAKGLGGAGTHGRQHSAQGREKRRVHVQYLYWTKT
ncbi:MAG: hypothetical protein DME26_20610 [Verrucomicrobia bacterium]|nr:MAG: hypothetical protein DME26_20610 [Verrucomicrobiota bacterium]